MRPSVSLAVVLATLTAVRLWIAARWDLIADEAYHWTWSLRPALGYYDQPPLVAWVLAAERAVLGDHALALRLASIVGWSAAVAALTPSARTREQWWWWALGLPPLAVLTVLAVPDALLLSLWGLAMAAAIRGGRGWWAAGLLAGLAGLSKYTGLAVLPLLIAGAEPRERRSVDPWLGLGLSLALLAPNLWWNHRHDWVSFRFQLAEGLWNPHPPGTWGVLRQVVDQALVVGPLAWGAAVVWAFGAGRRWKTLPRIDRMCLATSVPLLVGFAAAAVGGPPEAHWPAPAWIGAGLGLARTDGRVARLGYLGAVLAALGSAVLAVHSLEPVIRLPHDPAARLVEGKLLAEGVGRWALPAVAEPSETLPLPIYTERYQEAALIAWRAAVDGLPIEARTLPGCGRRSQYDLDAGHSALAEEAWFVRPARSGPPGCALRRYDEVRGPHLVRGIDALGRRVGPWDLFELAGPGGVLPGDPDEEPVP